MASEPSLVELEENENRERLRFEAAEGDVPPQPKRGRGRPPKTETPAKDTSGPQYKAGVIQRGFEDIYATVGTFWSMVDPVCGPALVQCAPKSAEVLEEMAKTNPQVRRILLKFLGTSAIGKLVAAHTPLIMAVFMHHGMGKIQHKHEEEKQQSQGPQYQGFQTDLFHQESPGMGVPFPDPDEEYRQDQEYQQAVREYFGDDAVPNSGHGFTYRMPDNPALRAG